MATILEIYRKDLACNGDFVKTASGDLDAIQGVENVRQALFGRLVASKGSLIHRPDYGVGIKDFQNSISSIQKQMQLSNRIVEQFSRDPRVEKVLEVSINYKDRTPERVELNIKVRLVGYGDTTLSFLPFEDQ